MDPAGEPFGSANEDEAAGGGFVGVPADGTELADEVDEFLEDKPSERRILEDLRLQRGSHKGPESAMRMSAGSFGGDGRRSAPEGPEALQTTSSACSRSRINYSIHLPSQEASS